MTPPKVFKRCSCCGIGITREAWSTLKLVGYQPYYDEQGNERADVRLELRNCACLSTLCIEVSR